MASKPALKSYFIDQLWNNNQVLVAILGICSALGVTTRLSAGITMGLSVIFVTGCSSFFVSLIRKHTPESVRMIAQLAIISMFVTIIAQLLMAFSFPLYKKLNVYVGLIITNCLVMGRAEAMAKSSKPLPALFDGLGAGAGYAAVLLFVAFLRELFGFGELFGVRVIPLSWYASPTNPNGYQDIGLMLTPPAAFFILGAMIGVSNFINRRKQGV